jgi:hypothetical protein
MATIRKIRTCDNGHPIPADDDNCPICNEIYSIWASRLSPYQIRKLQELYCQGSWEAGKERMGLIEETRKRISA